MLQTKPKKYVILFYYVLSSNNFLELALEKLKMEIFNVENYLINTFRITFS